MKKQTLSDTAPQQNIPLRWTSFSWIRRTTIIEAICMLYIVLFLYTGLNKMFFFSINEILFSQSEFLRPFSSILAWGVPIAEFIVSIFLFFPRVRMIGLFASLSLMIMFTIYIIITLLTSDDLPCSCGGIVQQLSWPQHIVFNIFFIALAIIAIVLLKKHNLVQHLKKTYLA